jgi:hypothetical protein
MLPGVAGSTESRPTKSERNLVVVRLRRGCRFGRWCRPAAGSGSAFLISSTAAATRAAAQKLQTFAHNLQLASFLSGLFVVPSVELETALDEYGTPFL